MMGIYQFGAYLNVIFQKKKNLMLFLTKGNGGNMV